MHRLFPYYRASDGKDCGYCTLELEEIVSKGTAIVHFRRKSIFIGNLYCYEDIPSKFLIDFHLP